MDLSGSSATLPYRLTVYIVLLVYSCNILPKTFFQECAVVINLSSLRVKISGESFEFSIGFNKSTLHQNMVPAKTDICLDDLIHREFVIICKITHYHRNSTPITTHISTQRDYMTFSSNGTRVSFL